LILVLTVSCVRTHEKLFTAYQLCKDKEEFRDPEDARDEHDTCLLFLDEELTNSAGCLKRCTNYCPTKDMKYTDSWTDFTGCHCYCQLDLS